MKNILSMCCRPCSQAGQRIATLLLFCACTGGGGSSSPPRQNTESVQITDVRRIVLIDAFRELTIGDTAQSLSAIVERLTGRVDTVAVAQVAGSDSNVVRVAGNRIVAVGQSILLLDVEGQRARAVVTVHATPFPGEPQTLELGADLICVPESRDPQTIVCRVRQNTRIILRHTGVSKRREKALAGIVIYRTSR